MVTNSHRDDHVRLYPASNSLILKRRSQKVSNTDGKDCALHHGNCGRVTTIFVLAVGKPGLMHFILDFRKPLCFRCEKMMSHALHSKSIHQLRRLSWSMSSETKPLTFGHSNTPVRDYGSIGMRHAPSSFSAFVAVWYVILITAPENIIIGAFMRQRGFKP